MPENIPVNQVKTNNAPGIDAFKKAPKPNKAKTKVKKKVNPAAILCIFLVVAFAAFAALVYFDIGGMKQTIVTLLDLKKPTAAQLQELEAKQKEFETQKQELSKVAAEQKKTASDQKKQAGELEKREKAVTEKETAVLAKEQELAALQTQIETKQVEETAMVQMFEKMDAAKAAQAISGMKSVTDMARILAGMASEKAAAILNNMEAKTATKVLTAVLKQKQ